MRSTLHLPSLDKINCFFGYNCIKSIILKIVQDKINVQDKTFPNMKNLKQIEEKMEKINNEQLKTSLNNFLKAYYDKY